MILTVVSVVTSLIRVSAPLGKFMRTLTSLSFQCPKIQWPTLKLRANHKTTKSYHYPVIAKELFLHFHSFGHWRINLPKWLKTYIILILEYQTQFSSISINCSTSVAVFALNWRNNASSGTSCAVAPNRQIHPAFVKKNNDGIQSHEEQHAFSGSHR